MPKTFVSCCATAQAIGSSLGWLNVGFLVPKTVPGNIYPRISFSFALLIIIPPLLFSPEAIDSPCHAAHYHISEPALRWLQNGDCAVLNGIAWPRAETGLDTRTMRVVRQAGRNAFSASLYHSHWFALSPSSFPHFPASRTACSAQLPLYHHRMEER
jgi:hypothetical protein